MTDSRLLTGYAAINSGALNKVTAITREARENCGATRSIAIHCVLAGVANDAYHAMHVSTLSVI